MKCTRTSQLIFCTLFATMSINAFGQTGKYVYSVSCTASDSLFCASEPSLYEIHVMESSLVLHIPDTPHNQLISRIVVGSTSQGAWMVLDSLEKVYKIEMADYGGIAAMVEKEYQLIRFVEDTIFNSNHCKYVKYEVSVDQSTWTEEFFYDENLFDNVSETIATSQFVFPFLVRSTRILPLQIIKTFTDKYSNSNAVVFTLQSYSPTYNSVLGTINSEYPEKNISKMFVE